jgi:hypothetical protein
MSAGFVTVYQTTDPIQAQMLTDVLVQEGLDARLLGTRNAPLLGVGQNIIRLRIEVPESQVAAAAALVEAWETAPPLAEDADVGAAAYDDEDSDDDADDADDERARVSPILAGGIAFLIPGAAHIYARRPWTGAALLAGLVLALVGMGGGRVEASASAVVLFGIVAYDLIGGQIAVRSFNRGIRLGFWRQLAVGAGALAVIGGAAAVIAPRVAFRRTRTPVEEQTSDHDRLRRRLDDIELDSRVGNFPFPVAPLSGQSSVPAGK